jgi:hypothetical protein
MSVAPAEDGVDLALALTLLVAGQERGDVRLCQSVRKRIPKDRLVHGSAAAKSLRQEYELTKGRS